MNTYIFSSPQYTKMSLEQPNYDLAKECVIYAYFECPKVIYDIILELSLKYRWYTIAIKLMRNEKDLEYGFLKSSKSFIPKECYDWDYCYSTYLKMAFESLFDFTAVFVNRLYNYSKSHKLQLGLGQKDEDDYRIIIYKMTPLEIYHSLLRLKLEDGGNIKDCMMIDSEGVVSTKDAIELLLTLLEYYQKSVEIDFFGNKMNVIDMLHLVYGDEGFESVCFMCNMFS